ncbi:MAG TPA: chromate resistance protein ChrB domain-containing protein [Chitinophagaceae bacterium]|nr:chromate resistance protein ChrB domain-containing protein [Chitinophagaceae bacterium]
MKWITRERPKIDRIACPWLIKRFIDKDAEFIYVPFEDVKSKADKLGAIPFDIPGVEFTHYEDKCTFDYIVQKYQIDDNAIHTLAPIIRGADTDRHNLATQASGLWAISSGLSSIIKDDQELLQKGMLLYDALYHWAKYHRNEKHTENAIEHLFIEVFDKYLKQKSAQKRIPTWVKELKEIIQDQIDMSISLKQISKDLDIHPTYLSREFSKYFDDLSFGDYIRKSRIEKSIEYLRQSKYSLTKIAYLTGFSDQSHFTRIFKKYTGYNPSAYRKKLQKK